MTLAYTTKWKQVSGALAAFWEGGAGPSRSNVIGAMDIAGIDLDPNWNGSKSDLILKAMKSANLPEQEQFAVELIDRLASEMHFDQNERCFQPRKVATLREKIQAVGWTLQEDGSLIPPDQDTDDESSPVASTLTVAPNTPVSAPAVAPNTPVSALALPANREQTEKVWGPSIQFLLEVLRDLPAAAKSLTGERRKAKTTVVVWDEYDIQDFIEVALRLNYKDVRPEEATPSVGGKGSRVDFYIKEDRVVVEAKVAYKGHANRALADELIIDIRRYQEKTDVKDLICVIYDLDGSLANPAGFEQQLSQNHSGPMRVHVVATTWPFSARLSAGATARTNTATSVSTS